MPWFLVLIYYFIEFRVYTLPALYELLLKHLSMF